MHLITQRNITISLCILLQFCLIWELPKKDIQLRSLCINSEFLEILRDSGKGGIIKKGKSDLHGAGALLRCFSYAVFLFVRYRFFFLQRCRFINCPNNMREETPDTCFSNEHDRLLKRKQIAKYCKNILYLSDYRFF